MEWRNENFQGVGGVGRDAGFAGGWRRVGSQSLHTPQARAREQVPTQDSESSDADGMLRTFLKVPASVHFCPLQSTARKAAALTSALPRLLLPFSKSVFSLKYIYTHIEKCINHKYTAQLTQWTPWVTPWISTSLAPRKPPTCSHTPKGNPYLAFCQSDCSGLF